MHFILGYTSHAKIRLLMVRIFFLMLFTSFMYVPLLWMKGVECWTMHVLWRVYLFEARLGWTFKIPSLRCA